jgi:hypothetical protein
MQVYLEFMGFDFIADVDWVLTHKGSPPTGGLNGPPENYDPGSDPEWDISTIHLQRELPMGKLGPAFQATGELFKTLSRLREIDDEILAYIENHGTDEDSYEPDYYQEDKDERMYERMYPTPDLPAEAYE